MNKQAHLSRRTFSRDYKRDLVEHALNSGLSNAAIAREHDINANQLAIWIKQYREQSGWARHNDREVTEQRQPNQ